MNTTMYSILIKRVRAVLMGSVLLLAVAGCDNAVYENASLNGCYAQVIGDSIFQLWFDGVEEFRDIRWTFLTGTVSWGGVYRVEQNRLILDYYSYDTEYHDLRLYDDGFYLGDDWYEYAGPSCQ